MGYPLEVRPGKNTQAKAIWTWISRFQFPRTSLEVGEEVSLDLGGYILLVTQTFHCLMESGVIQEGENGALKV